MTQSYSFADVAQILDVNENRLRYWAQSGLVVPSQRKVGKQVYSFTDLVSVKATKELVDRGFAPAHIQKALDAVRKSLPGVERPVDRMRVAFDGDVLVVVEDGAAFEPTGQRVFDFGLAELADRASSLLAMDPASSRTAPAWLAEGLKKEDTGDDEGAAACYRQALRVDAGLAAAHCNLGVVECRRGNSEVARAAFAEALSLDPEQPEARYNLALLIFQGGDVELAAAELRRVLQGTPDFADAHFNLATALEKLGGKQQAREHLQRYVDLAAGGGAAATPANETWLAEARVRIARLG